MHQALGTTWSYHGSLFFARTESPFTSTSSEKKGYGGLRQRWQRRQRGLASYFCVGAFLQSWAKAARSKTSIAASRLPERPGSQLEPAPMTSRPHAWCCVPRPVLETGASWHYSIASIRGFGRDSVPFLLVVKAHHEDVAYIRSKAHPDLLNRPRLTIR